MSDGERPAVAWGETRGPVTDRLGLAAGLAARLTAELAGRHEGPAVEDGRRHGSLVLITRPTAQADGLLAAFVARGLAPVAIPTIEIRPVDAGGELDDAILRAADASWIVVTSPNGAIAVLDAAARLGVDLTPARWAAVGSATRATLEARGIAVAFTPSIAEGEALAAELPIEAGATILLPRADLADRRLVDALEARGARVRAVVAYRTQEAPDAAREELRALFAAGAPDAIVFTSGSTVRGLLALLGSAHQGPARHALACCIGRTTAAAAAEAGFDRIVVAPAPTPAALADVIRDGLHPGRLDDIPEPAKEPRS
jgi:uroporphyrinogen III methyltransferase/synthase